jgi:putative DNA primase/helicase
VEIGNQTLHRLSEAQKEGMVVLIEGASNCHTLWFQGIPALGIPGARIAMLDT